MFEAIKCIFEVNYLLGKRRNRDKLPTGNVN